MHKWMVKYIEKEGKSARLHEMALFSYFSMACMRADGRAERADLHALGFGVLQVRNATPRRLNIPHTL